MTERLFVYGTLAPGRPNERVLAFVAGEWQKGSIRGHLCEQGWGATMGYPGVVLDENADEVHGWVLTSRELADHWARLDTFEGEGYERVKTSAQLADGSVAEVDVYVLAQSR